MRNVKTILLAIGLLAAVQQAVSQGYKKEKLTCKYRSFPLEPLSADIKTYQSTINPDKIDFRFIEKKPPKVYIESGSKTNYSSPQKCELEYLTVYGYERVDDNADLKITMNFSAVNVQSKELYEEVRRFIEDGDPVDRTTVNYKVTYTYGAKFLVQDKDGNVIYKEEYYDPSEVKTILVGDPSNGIGGNVFYVDELDVMYEKEFLKKYQNELTTDCLKKAEIKIKSDWAYPVYSDLFIISTKKTNKKLNYDDLNKAVNLMNKAFEAISQDEQKPYNQVFKDKATIDSYRTTLDEAIAIWQKALQEADFQDKKARIHRKLAPMLYCNIAIAQIFKKDWNAAAEAINSAKEYDESAYYAGTLLRHMEYLRKRYDLHGIQI